MNSETKDFYKRMQELSDRAYQNNQFTFSPFLSMGQISDFFLQAKLPTDNEFALSPSGFEIWGGYEDAERAMIRFGNPEELMYTQDFPINCLKISPLNARFSENLSHRDYLGALMNLSIERSLIGDILIKGFDGYCFVDESMSDFIVKEITRIKHTSVMCQVCDTPKDFFAPTFLDINIQAKSLRIDGIVAKLTSLSRSKCAELFLAKKIFINGYLMENESHQVKDGDVISIRGYGKYRFNTTTGRTKKENLNLNISKYN